jgi:acyl-coenzyme A thioesterase PaaI-like protein
MELTQQHGYFHAGVSGAIADSACGYAAYTLMPADSSVLTVEYKMNLPRPRMEKNWWRARGSCARGKR